MGSVTEEKEIKECEDMTGRCVFKVCVLRNRRRRRRSSSVARRSTKPVKQSVSRLQQRELGLTDQSWLSTLKEEVVLSELVPYLLSHVHQQQQQHRKPKQKKKISAKRRRLLSQNQKTEQADGFSVNENIET